MKVKELIEELSKHDPEMVVNFLDDRWGASSVNIVEIRDDCEVVEQRGPRKTWIKVQGVMLS